MSETDIMPTKPASQQPASQPACSSVTTHHSPQFRTVHCLYVGQSLTHSLTVGCGLWAVEGAAVGGRWFCCGFVVLVSFFLSFVFFRSFVVRSFVFVLRLRLTD